MTDPRKDLPPASAANFSERLRETISTYLGHRGNLLDRGVTLRDLTEANIIALGKGFLAGGGGPVIAGPGSAVNPPDEPDLTPPPTPTGFAVSAAISNLFISCAAPVYVVGHGHAKTIVYGAIWTSGALPTFANAVPIAEFTVTIFAHPSNPATRWHLWIKWVSVDGVASSAPAGGTNGLVAETGQDVSLLLTALTGEITASQLYSALGARIDLIDGPASLPNSLAQNVSFLRSYADLGVKTFSQASAPTNRGLNTTVTPNVTVPLVTGDIWISTALVGTPPAPGYQPYRWSGSAWVVASDYAAGASFDAWIASTYNPNATDFQAQIDGKLESWFQTTDPAAAWTTALLRQQHVGDLWYNSTTTVKKLSRYTSVSPFSTGSWVNIEDKAAIDAATAAATAQSTADGKIVTFAQTSQPTAAAIGDLWIDTDDGNRLYRWSGSAWVTVRDTTIAAVDARVTTVETTKIGYCSIGGVASDQTTKSACEVAGGVWNVGLPLATAVKQVSVTSGGVTASLEQKFVAQATTNTNQDTTNTNQGTTNTGLLAQYTIKLDNAGLVSGFGLASTSGTSAPTSAFGVRANQFYVAAPAVAQSTAPTTNLYDGYVWLDTSVVPNVTRYRSGASWVLNSPVLPFVVQTTPTTINGLPVPAGVYMPTAFIKNATITQAQIASVKADSITAGVLQAVVSQTGAMFNGVNAFTMTTDPTTGVVTATATGQTPGTAGFGTGYYLGSLGGTPQFFVGSPTSSLYWNGSSLTVRGTVYATAGEFRGVDVKDAAGNIILSSGSTLTSQMLSNAPDQLKGNLLDTSSWTMPSHGAVPGFNLNGGVYEQYRRTTTLPDGSQGASWQCYPGLYYNNAYGWDGTQAGGVPAGDADGGWNTDPFTVDTNRAYRFSVWMKHTGGNTGSVYLGCLSNTVRTLPGNVVDSNPYFFSAALSTLVVDRWYLAVGYVYPQSMNGNPQLFQSGLYDGKTGAKVANGSDFSWNPGITQSIHRAYLYYSAPASYLDLAAPRVDRANGSEPSLAQLLAGGSVSARNKITDGNASTYIADLAVNTLQIAGNAITLPLGFYAAAQFQAFEITASITINSTGQPIWLHFSAVTYQQKLEYNGARVWCWVELWRNDTLLRSCPGAAGVGYRDGNAEWHEMPVAFGLIDTPSAGSNTYSVRVKSSVPGTYGCYSTQRCLTVLECKR